MFRFISSFIISTGSNFHNGDGYVRRDLVPKHEPTLGEYDDSRPDTIAQHLRWSRQANIGLWITSWWGPNRLEDSNTKDVIMEHAELGDMKIALHYETSNVSLAICMRIFPLLQFILSNRILPPACPCRIDRNQ
jgi:hypothetical protein